MNTEILIQIKAEGDEFPSPDELQRRDDLEDALMKQSGMQVVDVGSGLGVMEIVVEAQDGEKAARTIQRLLKEHQLEQITEVSIKYPKKTKIKVRAGDLFCVIPDEGLAVVGIVLHVSKLIKNGILVGFYDQCFESVEDIDIEALRGEFITTPNYTGKQLIAEGRWRIVGHSPALLASARIPELRIVNTVYFKDEVVRQLTSARKFSKYTELSGQGGIFVENILREHFQGAG